MTSARNTKYVIGFALLATPLTDPGGQNIALAIIVDQAA
jgi:hypothetical protein